MQYFILICVEIAICLMTSLFLETWKICSVLLCSICQQTEHEISHLVHSKRGQSTYHKFQLIGGGKVPYKLLILYKPIDSDIITQIDECM